jgi:hypothetical protein
MTEPGESRAQQLLGDTASDLVRLTDEVLFGDVGPITGCPSVIAAW